LSARLIDLHGSLLGCAPPVGALRPLNSSACAVLADKCYKRHLKSGLIQLRELVSGIAKNRFLKSSLPVGLPPLLFEENILLSL